MCGKKEARKPNLICRWSHVKHLDRYIVIRLIQRNVFVFLFPDFTIMNHISLNSHRKSIKTVYFERKIAAHNATTITITTRHTIMVSPRSNIRCGNEEIECQFFLFLGQTQYKIHLIIYKKTPYKVYVHTIHRTKHALLSFRCPTWWLTNSMIWSFLSRKFSL